MHSRQPRLHQQLALSPSRPVTVATGSGSIEWFTCRHLDNQSGAASPGQDPARPCQALQQEPIITRVTNASGCTSPASANVVINAQPATPTAPTVGTITQPTCAVATGSVILNGLPAGTWTINPGSISGTGSSTTLSGLAAGTYNYTVTNASGCTSPASANVVINPQPTTPTAPVVGTITQPTCAVATGSVILNGLPAGTWTINPGSISGTGSSTTLSGLAAGTYNYTVTNAAGCTSPASANVVINPQPTTPTAPVVGTIHPADLYSSNGQCSSERLTCRHLDDQPGQYLRNRLKHDLIRPCRRIL